MDFKGKTIALGVTGGIAAYKACDIISMLKKAGADVVVTLTQNATEFITPLTLETLSGNRVITNTFSRDFEYSTKHISIAKKADLFIIAPATANFIAKYANGIADDFLSTTILACKCPVLIAPAMNNNMLEHPATQQNIEILKNRGVHFMESEVGMLACGVVGKGRLAKPSDIVANAYEILNNNCRGEKVSLEFNKKKDFNSKTFLITTGGTTINIDPVRFIGNHSSGKMGFELAKSAKERGAKVILVAGRISDEIAHKIESANFDKVIHAQTTAEMYSAVMDNLSQADYIIKAGAPSDYIIENQNNQKLKSETLILTLKKTPTLQKRLAKLKAIKN
ncbi:MAG: bifunctional phosphopantothenoylcysteine decarboxylase/phosphopantothenate--cysteine ligase CoaBC [Firmicutes bacterium]|nr:bifunctional phosphopantothenoylcysteine decarboxylase/phosphopantothenate--cysteine ligase CoaBC [Bacillota bacterium]